MSTYTPERLLALWSQEKIDEKMVVGHILQNLAEQQKAQAAMSVTVYGFQNKFDTLKAELEKVKMAVDRLRALIDNLLSNQSKSNPDRPS